jgi:hypothetical protein
VLTFGVFPFRSRNSSRRSASPPMLSSMQSSARARSDGRGLLLSLKP